MEVAQRSSKRKTMARVPNINPSGSPVMNTRSRARKQASKEPTAEAPKTEVSPQPKYSKRKTVMLPPAFESTRIESAPTVRKTPNSPGKNGFEEDIPKKEEQYKDVCIQTSLCRNCNSGNSWSLWKPFFMAFVLMLVTLYCRGIINIELWKQYAMNLNNPSVMLAQLKLDEYWEFSNASTTLRVTGV
ncbi:uncharacterized protein LOC100900708 [Galendromus occidentalis]|uniref:Uncharacterized protein LOC100900708 n=1 Tax=Galendromus occidentalis TaxID=34638 RepID=A0AAJ6QX18_9ACAR|nr:uncharacterized protein LOC100900708 [Galendromus occidentalis]